MNRYHRIALLFVLVAGLLAATPLPTLAAGAAGPRAVLVTGASSGIGRNIAETLAANGVFVYAGARKEADLAELDAIPNVKGVRLDVTVQADIDSAVRFIREQGRGLHGVVNNAGVGVFSPMNETPEQDLDFVFDVNVYGPYRVNKAFAPLLVESGGRTTTIGSISGFISGAHSGTYSMSKFAVEAYTDALAEEMADSGVLVSVVEPGRYRSLIREKVVLHDLGIALADTAALDAEAKQALQGTIAHNDALKEPDEVSAAVMHALFAEAPKRRYMVVPNAMEAGVTLRAAMARVVQLNADQVYSYDRDQLVALLDSLRTELPAASR